MVIRVGTSGYAFDDWRGIVYPSWLKQDGWLRYYERQLGFDCLEVNYTYYRPPSPKTSEKMVLSTSKTFRFTVKLTREQTHEQSLEGVKAFLTGIAPLAEAGKLAALLAQFPTSFTVTPRRLEFLVRLKEAFMPHPLAVEFRHASWNRQEVFDLLSEHHLAFCVVDEPRLEPLMPLVPRNTCDIGYVRLHGRSQRWFGACCAERYNYLYDESELRDISSFVQTLSTKTSTTYVFFNNCHMGAAAKNALQLKEMLGLGTPSTFSPELF